MVAYSYPLPKRFDPYYLRSILEKEFPDNFIGWLETLKEIRIDFMRSLTNEEKSKLDRIIREPPMPKTVLTFEPDIASEIEGLIRKKPTRVDYDPTTGRCTLWFDVDITSTEEKAIETYLKEKHLGTIKRRKP